MKELQELEQKMKQEQEERQLQLEQFAKHVAEEKNNKNSQQYDSK